MIRMKQAAYLALLWGLASTLAQAEDKPAADAPKAARTAPAKLWSWQPVQRSDEPVIKQKDWVRTPIDAFVLARLEAKGIKPSQDADRAAFIRRATLDVWGVIPSPEEVKAFVADRSPDAYEKLVDRLLSSPKYGERQARRWLDLARYADSTGFQNDTTRPNMWRYRDYVVNSFNQDKPYDRFIKEQLAGDEIAPNDPNALIATGFLLNYPDNYNSRDLVQRQYQIATDMTDTVGQALLGTTLGCARCHNHKSDKITQKDYFSLLAFFANVTVNEKVPLKEKGADDRKFEEQQAKYQAATREIRDKQKAIIDTVREAGEKYHKERYLTDSRDAIFKPKEQWTPLDRWVNHRLANVSSDRDVAGYLRLTAEDKNHPQHTAENIAKWAEYQKLGEQLKRFDNLRPESGSRYISAATELGPDSPPTHIRFTGVHERPLDEVQPAFPVALTGEKPEIVPSATSSGRRTALANWIASPNNPLTARVFVNRIWNQYFGTGIVKTVSDFGKAGEKPSNPELLEYLADDFVKEGWSVKKLHRQILLSSVYRQSSAHRADVFQADPENKLLAVFPRKRLDAEQIRDSLLVASGQLEGRIGGPAVLPPLPGNVNVGNNTFDDNPLWKVSKDVHDHNRRSLYVFTRRSVPYPMLEVFDPANPQLVHSTRDVTTTPLQALTLFNDDLVFAWSQALAGRVINEAGNSEAAQVDRLYQILFARNADKFEKAALHEFLNKQEKIIQSKAADGKFVVSIPSGVKTPQAQSPLRLAAFVDLVHTVANSNEFSYRF
ncbi:MAG TPA: DUF1549 and DUF1553 domain-containing protein [Gallionella sp.]|nr:DUF1549 and DUF1553 domain-containing protein [Gallionella sp.]